jgi:hypothetical protein
MRDNQCMRTAECVIKFILFILQIKFDASCGDGGRRQML